MKKNLILIALISICAITKAQTADMLSEKEFEVLFKTELEKSYARTFIGSTIKFAKCPSISFFNIVPDTLWIRQRRNPQIGKDFYLCEIYKGIERPYSRPITSYNKLVTKNGVNYYADNRGFISGHTSCQYKTDREFLVTKYNFTRREERLNVVVMEFFLELQDITTGEQLIHKYRIRETRIFQREACWRHKEFIKHIVFVDKGSGVKNIEQRIRENFSKNLEKKKKELERELEKKKREFENIKADGKHTLSLTKVEKPKNSQIRFGKTEMKEAGTRYSYADNYINIIWIPTSTNFHFILTNNSPHSMRVIWDEAVYVDENGRVDKVIHEGVRLINRNNPQQTPTTVLKDASLSDFLAPVSKINSNGSQRPLFSKTDGKKLENKTVRISLPLQIQNVTNEYVFTFTIKWEYKHPEMRNMEFEEWLEKQ